MEIRCRRPPKLARKRFSRRGGRPSSPGWLAHKLHASGLESCDTASARTCGPARFRREPKRCLGCLIRVTFEKVTGRICKHRYRDCPGELLRLQPANSSTLHQSRHPALLRGALASALRAAGLENGTDNCPFER